MGKPLSRSLHLTGAACFGNTLLGVGKLALGILSLSFFTCASALYTFGMVAARLCALAGIAREDNPHGQYRCYRRSGLVLAASSLMYILYSVRLFQHPATAAYHEYVALAIAAFTFTEITVNIRGLIVYRRDHTPLVHAIKMIKLASSLISLVLTQTAILSFTAPGTKGASLYTALIGIVMGTIATVLGILMIRRPPRTPIPETGGMRND